MKDRTYYLVTLRCKKTATEDWYENRLVVDLHPTDWFAASGWYKQYVLVNFWEVTEGTFGEFPHDMQNTAWDELHQLTGDEE